MEKTVFPKVVRPSTLHDILNWCTFQSKIILKRLPQKVPMSCLLQAGYWNFLK